MRVFENVAARLPAPLVDMLESLARLLSDHQRLRLRRVIDSLPLEERPLVQAIDLISAEWNSFFNLSANRIVVLGPTNTGKSSVVNALLGRSSAPVSSHPRTTCASQPYQGDVFTVIDTPGIDEYLGYDSAKLWLREAAEADLVLLVLDATLGLNERTLQLVHTLEQLDRPLLVLLNKLDLLRDRSSVLARARADLGQYVVGVSALEPQSTRKLIAAIVDGNPDTYRTLADSFPQHRSLIASAVVTRSAMLAGTLAALPLRRLLGWSVAAVQGSMVLKVGRVFGHSLGVERLRELFPVLAGGFAMQSAVSRLGALRGGAALEVALAGLSTYGLGQGAISYFRHQGQHGPPRPAVVVDYHNWIEPRSKQDEQ